MLSLKIVGSESSLLSESALRSCKVKVLLEQDEDWRELNDGNLYVDRKRARRKIIIENSGNFVPDISEELIGKKFEIILNYRQRSLIDDDFIKFSKENRCYGVQVVKEIKEDYKGYVAISENMVNEEDIGSEKGLYAEYSPIFVGYLKSFNILADSNSLKYDYKMEYVEQ